MRLGLLVTLAAIVVLAVAVLVPPAHAAEPALPTRSQVAMDAAWLSHLAPEDLPPVERRGIVCLVDTGVDVTPDLPEDRPEGPIVARRVASALRYDGDTDDGQGGTTEAGGHGTSMASLIAAPPGNDWGTVGLVPWVRVLSVRAMPKGAEEFPGEAYRNAIADCQVERQAWPALAVVSLALSCHCNLDSREADRLAEAVQRGRQAGLSVVAAAGNASSWDLATPADTPGVLPVAAGTTEGNLCSFSNWAASAISASGCEVDGPPGTSTAAAHAAALLAALRGLASASSATAVEEALSNSAATVEGRRVVNVRAAAMRLGLEGVVSRAEARMAAEPPGDLASGGYVADAATSSGRAADRVLDLQVLARPRARLRRASQNILEVRVLNRPRGADVQVRMGSRFITTRSSRVRLGRSLPRTVRLRYIRDDALSAWISVRHSVRSRRQV